MSSIIRCSRCGRRLTDPVSRAIRIGPECRGDSRPRTRRALKASNNVGRGAAYVQKQPIQIGANLVYTFTGEGWKREGAEHISTHESFGEWLKQFGLVTMPSDYLATLKDHKVSAAAILKESKLELEIEQKSLIKAEISRLGTDIKRFAALARLQNLKGGKHVKSASNAQKAKEG